VRFNHPAFLGGDSQDYEDLENFMFIRLVIITVANSSFPGGLQDALMAYFDLWPEFKATSPSSTSRSTI